MKIHLSNKYTKPPFSFYVKENTSSFDYYVYHDFETAMEKARILSLTKFPISIILEPYQTEDKEWKLKRIFRFSKGRCVEDEKLLLHTKFYTDAGECLNQEELENNL